MNHLLEKIKRLNQYRSPRCNRPDIKVACILDTFSYECFKYECLLEQLHAKTWKKQLHRLSPHFLFVESAWKGLDETWKHRLINIKKKTRTPIRKVIAYCKRKGIPTVFWNKEDPPHFQRFLATARLFDFVFTSDENCIPLYKRKLKHLRIFPLPFAAQPVIHNPVHARYELKENVAFAGTWYEKKYPQRKIDMSIVLNPARQYNLQIFDRKHDDKGNSGCRFPKQFHAYINGCLLYEDMVSAYKLYKVFLNVNSVRDSPTMFSRRVFEILASGTNVISTYSLGIKKLFHGIVPIVHSEEETKLYLLRCLENPHYSERLSLLGIREVHRKHLYEHRFNLILKKLGYPTSPMKGVTVIAFVNRSTTVDSVYASFKKQSWTAKELIVVHEQRIQKMMETLRSAIMRSPYDFIAFINDRDYFGADYLTDLMHAFHYTDAQIIGKSSHYIATNSQQQLILRNPHEENRYVHRLPNFTMVVKKSVFSQVFPNFQARLVWSEFFSACKDAGIKIYSADKFNYLCRSQPTGTRFNRKASIPLLKSDVIVSCGKDIIGYVTV